MVDHSWSEYDVGSAVACIGLKASVEEEVDALYKSWCGVDVIGIGNFLPLLGNTGSAVELLGILNVVGAVRDEYIIFRLFVDN